eukprot:TRINITY_DN6020_c0_g2_i1.p1 TRINITY_DN6020_c0_g2~~TRINITY_DN6020_c0_g2_i1.p1  ORF type:complete len:420 (-),score=82.80 TRINITY_DN6020_c0_g2_i1:71-1330(-)
MSNQPSPRIGDNIKYRIIDNGNSSSVLLPSTSTSTLTFSPNLNKHSHIIIPITPPTPSSFSQPPQPTPQNSITLPNNTQSSTLTIFGISSVILTTLCFLVYYARNLFVFLDAIRDVGGVLGAVIFTLSYLFSALPFAIFSIYIPLSLSAAFMYGYLIGMLTITTGSFFGACFGFWVTRKFARRWIEDRIRESEKLSNIMDTLGPHTFKITLGMRFLPIPFGLQNALCAMTNISMQQFMLSTAIGLLPENLLLAYFGGSVRDVAELNADEPITGSSFQKVLLVIALLLGVAIFFVGRRFLLPSSTEAPRKKHRRASSSSITHPKIVKNSLKGEKRKLKGEKGENDSGTEADDELHYENNEAVNKLQKLEDNIYIHTQSSQIINSNSSSSGGGLIESVGSPHILKLESKQIQDVFINKSQI